MRSESPPQVNDSTILHWAALHGAVAQLDKLVQRGANVEAKTGYVSTAPHLPSPASPPLQSLRARTVFVSAFFLRQTCSPR